MFDNINLSTAILLLPSFKGESTIFEKGTSLSLTGECVVVGVSVSVLHRQREEREIIK